MLKSKVYYRVWPDPRLPCKVSYREKKCQRKTHHKIFQRKNANVFNNIPREFCLQFHRNFLFSEQKDYENLQQIHDWVGISLFRFNRHGQHLRIFHFHLQAVKWLAWFQVQKRSSWSDSWTFDTILDTSHKF